MKPLSLKAAIYLRAAELVEMGHCKGDLWWSSTLGEWCRSYQATHFCYYGARLRAEEEITGHMSPISEMPLAEWNDRPDTTAAEVAARLREEAFKE